MTGTTSFLADARPPPLDLSHHYSRSTKKQVGNNLKRFYKYFMIPGIGNLAGGLPNDRYFPYDTLEAQTALPERFKPTPNDPVDPPSEELKKFSLSDKSTTSRVLVPHNSPESNLLRKIDIASALQYGTAQGYPALYAWLKQFTNEVYHPNIPYRGGAEIILDCGSTDGLSKVFEVFFNHWDKDRDWIREREGLLVEEFVYSPAVGQSKPRDVNIVPVALDEEGMCPFGKGGLLDVMENWDFSKGKRPHVMYTVTMGQNPTSGLLSLARRKEIYQICSEYDVIIVEDDPYWYLQYPSANTLSIKYRGRPISPNYPSLGHNYNYPQSSGYPFLDSLVPSYLSIDTDGRVVRLDTFSKTVAPGCRLGWVTAQPAFIDKLLRITETTTQQPSGFVQSLIAELLIGPSDTTPDGGTGGRKDGKGWKADGWIRWLEGLRGNYERRMNTMVDALEAGRYLINDNSNANDAHHRRPTTSESNGSSSSDEFSLISKTELYSYRIPPAGMFLWLIVNIESHPLLPHPSSAPSPGSSHRYPPLTPSRLMLALWLYLTQPPNLVLVTPGSAFAANEFIQSSRGYKCLRFCFAAVPEDDVEILTRRFVEAVKSFWGMGRKAVERILKEGEEDLAAEVFGVSIRSSAATVPQGQATGNVNGNEKARELVERMTEIEESRRFETVGELFGGHFC